MTLFINFKTLLLLLSLREKLLVQCLSQNSHILGHALSRTKKKT